MEDLVHLNVRLKKVCPHDPQVLELVDDSGLAKGFLSICAHADPRVFAALDSIEAVLAEVNRPFPADLQGCSDVCSTVVNKAALGGICDTCAAHCLEVILRLGLAAKFGIRVVAVEEAFHLVRYAEDIEYSCGMLRFLSVELLC